MFTPAVFKPGEDNKAKDHCNDWWPEDIALLDNSDDDPFTFQASAPISYETQTQNVFSVFLQYVNHYFDYKTTAPKRGEARTGIIVAADPYRGVQPAEYPSNWMGRSHPDF